MSERSLALNDRGLAFGDGLFETLFVHAGRPVLLGEHLARLRFGLVRLGLPEPSPEQVFAALEAAIEPGRHGVCKLLVTAGPGRRGYRRPEDINLTVEAMFGPLPEPPDAGVVVGVSPVTLTGIEQLRGLKHLNRLPQVIAQERMPAGAGEALMRDAEGRVVSGTMSNLFWREGNRWCTPPVVDGAIAGTRRAWWIERLSADIVPCAPGRLALAEEAFFCNALSAWRPVSVLVGRALRVTQAPPGDAVVPIEGFWQPPADPDGNEMPVRAAWSDSLADALAGTHWGRLARQELGGGTPD
ncbi:aminotransferase class IV [Guyparkeria sp.]|uniref:aminotransferase class IV n=1 Tax=Guyparkeria sp. TaxID=2035736 RepID=UPI003569A40B